MPGLLRGVARTAVIAGTATSVSNRVSRRQAGRWSRQAEQQQAYAEPQPQQQQYYAPPPPPPPPPADPMAGKLEQLQQLGELKKQGVLTEAEFAQQKARILGS
ncbi:SHOCT domain-containing protein [Actinoplanes sp. GCM10030250]|uniref:SHOCT domain-containing protein n=1 Tax=Actinoplanes sp. GCM10030250 TaxID=3273376 RepID=UPI003624681B